MKPLSLHGLCVAFALVALAVGSVLVGAAQPINSTGSGREVAVTGHIVKMEPTAGRLTLQTRDGKQLEMDVDPRSEVKLHGQTAKLSQFKQGVRVRVRYQAVDGKNRVVSLRDAPVTAEELRQDLRDALQSAKTYTYQQKEEYQKRLEPVLHDLDDRIEHLKERAKRAGKEAQKQYEEAIQELQRERQVVRRQLAKVQAAAPGAWDEVKSGMNAAWEDLRKAFQRAHDRLKESEPPDKP